MSIEPRPEIALLTEAVHGGLDEIELAARGIDPQRVLDFSTNVNPFGPSDSARTALAGAALDCYPDRDALRLRRVIAEELGVPFERILAGNGASELVQLVALAFLGPGDAALIVGPTYAEYARAAAISGAKSLFWNAPVEADFAIDVDLVRASLLATRPRLCFLCNPNNPTGTLLAADSIRRWIAEFPQTLFVVDEAYLEFAPEAQSLVTDCRQNLIVLRSLTKAHGLAGLRLGFAVAHPQIVGDLCRVRVPWSVSSPAQAAGIAALRHRDHLDRSLLRLCDAKLALAGDLQTLGLRLIPSTTNFVLARVGNAAEIRSALLSSGILVRDCTSFGLPDFIRVSARDQSDNRKLIAALQSLRTCLHK